MKRARWQFRLPMVLTCLAFACLGASCSPSATPPAPAAPAPRPVTTAPAKEAPETPPATEKPATATQATGGHLRIAMTITDLQGKPLAGINPIATLRPNAFDKPVAVGPLSNAEGKAELQLKPDKTTFVRAWDPALNWFPNNFFEVPPSTEVAASEAAITMVPASTLLVQFTLPDNSPAASQGVSLMMIHAQWGPWWPAESQTDASGQAVFPNIPPGIYDLQFKLADGQTGLSPKAEIRPGTQTDLAIVPLQ